MSQARNLLLAGLCVAALAACVEPIGAMGDEYGGDYPPDAYIATTQPVYFEGRAAYWWGNHWYYRDGGGWHGWARPPAALQEHRAAPVRQFYERGHATYRAPTYHSAPAARHR
jgi:hypothetical protein